MIVNYDAFDQIEMPYVVLTNPNKQEMYALSGIIYNTKITKRFNGLSEFEFTIPSTTDNSDTIIEAYDYVQAKRLILIEGEGYFIIDGVDENTDGQHHVKIVRSKSLEAEMLNKRFNSYKGTFKFYNFITVPGQTTILDTVIALLPTWSVGYVDSAIAVKYRTFDVNDTTVYGFLINDCEKAFECIFIFDTVAKTINVYSTANATTSTDIYLSYDNLIKNSTMSEITDEIATSLYCTGGGTLGINLVNPLGTNKIYDFSYYKNINWMSQDLIDAITTWEALITFNQAPYAALLTDYRIKNLELITLQNELIALNEQYVVKETEQKVRIQAGQSISSVNAMLITIRGWITAKQAEITAKQAELTVILNSAIAINTALSFDTNFTPTQFDELSEFIYENSYQNSNLIVTDQSTPVDYQDTSQELYDQSISVLSRSSLPRYEFKMDTANFVAMKEYSAFTGELALGCTVTVNVNDNYTVVPVLLEISRSYDDPTQFTLTFSNRLRLDNGNFQYADLMGQVVSTGSAVAGNADQWSNWDNNYKDTVSTFITSALDASRNAVVNSSNQEIIINTNGLRGKTLTSPGVYDPHQVWLTSNILAFTDDNWDTAKLALGQIVWNGNTVYGLVADVVVGKLLAGNQLTITNEGSNFTLDQSGARLNNASFVIQNNNMAIVMTPNEETVNGITSHGISIQSKATGIWENVFYTDADGNLIIKGTFSVSNGDLGGWHINSTGLYDDLGNYIYSNGNVHLGGMTLTPGSARFTGDIYASRLFGRVVGAPNYQFNSITDAYIGSLNASKITAGEMVADRIYGGTMRGPNGISLSLSTTNRPILAGNNGVSILPANDGVPDQSGQGIDVYKGYNIIGYEVNNLMGLTEFTNQVRVTGGGTGINQDIIYKDGAGINQTLKVRSGIIVGGAPGPWGLSGSSSGSIVPVVATPWTGGDKGNILAILFENYGVWYTDLSNPSWFSGTPSGYSGAELTSLNNFELINNTMVIYLTSSLLVYTGTLGAFGKTEIGTNALFRAAYSEASYTDYAIIGIGVDQALERLAVYTGGAWTDVTWRQSNLFLADSSSGYSLTKRLQVREWGQGNAAPAIPTGSMTYYAGKWYASMDYGVSQVYRVRRFSDSLASYETEIASGVSNQFYYHIHAKSSDYIYGHNPAYKFTSLGTVGAATVMDNGSKNQTQDCSPDGSVVISTYNNNIFKSINFGVTKSSITANLPASILSGTLIVKNLGDNLRWCVSYRNSGGYTEVLTSSDGGTTWTSILSNLPTAIPATANPLIMRATIS